MAPLGVLVPKTSLNTFFGKRDGKGKMFQQLWFLGLFDPQGFLKTRKTREAAGEDCPKVYAYFLSG